MKVGRVVYIKNRYFRQRSRAPFLEGMIEKFLKENPKISFADLGEMALLRFFSDFYDDNRARTVYAASLIAYDLKGRADMKIDVDLDEEELV